MLNYKKDNEARKLVSDTFKEVKDLVVPTMGAKGLYVAINQDFGGATLTDDGVTVAREAAKMNGMQRMISMDMIEAANNTEKEALDGTTLTVLLTNAIYQRGYKMIKRGMHPQLAADKLDEEIQLVRKNLKKKRMRMSAKHVKDIATISTKIPLIGELVAEAYKKAGDDMNIIVEHDRGSAGFNIEHTQGFTIESGYMTDAMSAMNNDEGKWIGEDAHIVLLKEGIMTQVGINKFFNSIPGEEVNKPFVFILNPDFNPNTLRILIDTLIKNNFKFQFIFVNEIKPDDLYMDIAAYTEGTVQDASQGIGEYEFKYCGKADHIVIEIDKTIITNKEKSKEVDRRVKSYTDRLEKGKYKLSMTEKNTYERRLSSLSKGIVKIKIGVPTVTEYKTIQLKLDDAIGAVRKAFQHGIVLGGGLTLYTLSEEYPYKYVKQLLQEPMYTICKNAGVKNTPGQIRRELKKYPGNKHAYNVVTNEVVDLKKAGILDSYLSIDEALKNSCSIACSYLRTNTLIIKETTQSK